VNAEDLPHARVNGDGSLDVWVQGRRLRFPGGGRTPTVAEDPAPPTGAGEVPDDVLMDVGDDMTTISHDGWYVRFSGSTMTINRTRAFRSERARRFFRYGRDG
jgi:hypothetical protein